MIKYLFIITFFLSINISYWYDYLEEIWDYKWKIFYIKKDSPYKVVSSRSINGESLESLVNKVWWVAWINWSYFCPADYKACNWKNTFNWDRISNWNISSRWNNTWSRFIFWFDKNNNSLIYQTSWRSVDSFHWIYNWISNFPLILKEWESYLDYYEKAWLIDSKMKLKWYKNFICSTKDWDIYMWYIVDQTIYDMVNVLKNLWCYNALNLDSWWSLSVYDKWYKRWPWRDIMDAFVIVEDKRRIDKLNKKVDIISLKLNKYIDSKKSSWIVRNKLIYILEKYLNKKLSYNTRYLIEWVIEKIKKD